MPDDTLAGPDVVSCPNDTVPVYVANSLGQPLPEALVTLYKPSEVYLRGTTGANGWVTFVSGPSTNGRMLITCTKHNYIPHQGEIRVEYGCDLGGPGAKAATILPALIWNPHEYADGDSLYQTLLRARYEATMTTDLTLYLDSLADYHIFIMARWEPDHEEFIWEDFQSVSTAVISFPDGGGSLYWQGATEFNVISYYVPGLNDYFQLGIHGIPHPISYLRELNSNLYGPIFDDIDSLVCSGGTYAIDSFCGSGDGEIVMAMGPNGEQNITGIICQVGQTHTILTDFSWARLNDSGSNTRVDLIHDVMDWLSGVVAVEEPEPLPAQFSLSQNYPNPFNAQTTIDYALPKGGPITLQVYDICGRVVATLVNGAMPAGYHQVAWDAKGMSSGLYFLRLQAEGFTETRKMTLVK